MAREDLRAVAAELRSLVAHEGARLRALEAEVAARPRAPGKWSPKEVVGHLVDSASNNHQRFVRLRLADGLAIPGYDADDWVRVGGYATYPWPDLLTLWTAYNGLLAHVIEAVEPEAQPRTWSPPDGTPIDLAALVIDYLRHMRHHLAQIPQPHPSG
jgi:hypothetical protein